MIDVFISYSRANQDFVRRVAEAVKRLGYSVWWDDELPPHRSYSEVITEKIGEARAAIVVWSGGSIGSEWVRAEADLARNQKKLIQTSMDDCMPPMPFNQIQFASLAGWDGGDDHPGWSKVKGSLAALCGAGTDDRSVYPLPDSPQPSTPPVTEVTAVTSPQPMAARPAPRRSNILVGAMIGGSIAVIAGVGVLALIRSGGAPAVNQAAAQPPPGNSARLTFPEPETLPRPAPPTKAAVPRPAPPQAPPRQTAARRTQQAAVAQNPQPERQAAMPMRARRYCMTHMAECMEMRRNRRGY